MITERHALAVQAIGIALEYLNSSGDTRAAREVLENYVLNVLTKAEADAYWKLIDEEKLS